MARMLAESLSSAPTISVTASMAGWLVFVLLGGICAAVVPAIAWTLRRRLPSSRRKPIRLAPVVFGYSPKSRQSPRQSILAHRILITTSIGALLALIVMPGVTALRTLGVSALQVAIALVLPTFVVALHARNRSLTR